MRAAQAAHLQLVRAVRTELAARARQRRREDDDAFEDAGFEVGARRGNGNGDADCVESLVRRWEESDGVSPEFTRAAAAAQRSLALAVSAELEDQLTDVLICLGQESTKVEVLTFALESFGVEVPRLLAESGYADVSFDESTEEAPDQDTLPRDATDRAVQARSQGQGLATLLSEAADEASAVPHTPSRRYAHLLPHGVNGSPFARVATTTARARAASISRGGDGLENGHGDVDSDPLPPIRLNLVDMEENGKVAAEGGGKADVSPLLAERRVTRRRLTGGRNQGSDESDMRCEAAAGVPASSAETRGASDDTFLVENGVGGVRTPPGSGDRANPNDVWKTSSSSSDSAFDDDVDEGSGGGERCPSNNACIQEGESVTRPQGHERWSVSDGSDTLSGLGALSIASGPSIVEEYYSACGSRRSGCDSASEMLKCSSSSGDDMSVSLHAVPGESRESGQTRGHHVSLGVPHPGAATGHRPDYRGMVGATLVTECGVAGMVADEDEESRSIIYSLGAAGKDAAFASSRSAPEHPTVLHSRWPSKQSSARGDEVLEVFRPVGAREWRNIIESAF